MYIASIVMYIRIFLSKFRRIALNDGMFKEFGLIVRGGRGDTECSWPIDNSFSRPRAGA